MKVLWCTYDRSRRSECYYEQWLDGLKRVLDITIIRASLKELRLAEYRKRVVAGTLEPDRNLFIKGINKNYDIIVCEEMFTYWNDLWSSIKIPKALFIEDLHANNPRQIAKAIRGRFDAIFFRYKTHFEKEFSSLKGKCKCIWVPMSVDTNFFKPRGDKIRDVVMFGVVNNTYPVRQAIYKELRHELYFERIWRPKEMFESWERWPTGKDYVEIINSAKICPTGGSIFNYPVAKFFEIPACNTLLMSDWFDELGLLGFKHGENMVVLKLGKIASQVRWWLNSNSERRQVAANGLKLVTEKHSTKVRARQFVAHLKEILKA